MDLAELTPKQIEQLEKQLLDRAQRLRFYDWFPDEGQLRRELYSKHVAFFNGGAKYNERLFMAGNRVGKSIAGAYELTCHLTGLYPAWWTGARFDDHINAWAVGKTSETTRDVVQLALLGHPNAVGTGMIPSDCIVDYRFKPNTNQSLDWVTVKNVTGKDSWLGLKSYDQGRKAFEGTEKEVVWLDEEPPSAIYTECLTRTATVDGIVFCTFTPLEGATEMVQSFLQPGVDRA